mgnify:CR=1 FL=1
MKFLNRYFWVRFLVSYLTILIIPCLLTIFIYRDMVAQTEKNIHENHLSSLRQVGQFISGQLYGAENLAHQLDANAVLVRYTTLLNPLVDPDAASDFYRVPQAIASYLVTNDVIGQVQVYARKSDTIVTAGTCYLRLDNAYGQSFGIEGMDLRTWRSEYLEPTYRGVFLKNVPARFPSGKGTYIVYAKTMQNVLKTETANIFIYIDQKRLLELFDSMNGIGTGFAYIADAQGTWMSRTNLSQETVTAIEEKAVASQGYFRLRDSARDLFVTYVKEGKEELTYVAAVPYAYIAGNSRNTRLLLGGLLALCILFGIALAIGFSYQQARPIRRIVERLSGSKQDEAGASAYAFINDRLSDLINRNDTLRDEVERQLPATRLSLIYRLLNGDTLRDDALREDFKRQGIDTEGRYHVVLIASVNDTGRNISVEEIAAHKVMIKEELTRHMTSIIGLYDIDYEKQAIILSSRYENHVELVEALNRNVESIKARLQAELNISISFSGSMTDDFSRIYMAYYEARQALGYRKTLNDMAIVWYRKGADKTEPFLQYPMPVEIRLIDALRAGNAAECRGVLAQVQKANQQVLIRELPAARQLFHAILGSVMRAFEGVREGDAPLLRKHAVELESCIESGLGAMDKFTRFREILLDICGEQREAGGGREILQIEKVLAYVHQHFTESSLSLSSVATAFHVTEIYLSHFFKENTGENFSKCVERLRMEKSRQLMAENSLSLATIAEKVGYNSPQVFRRVYKRQFGKSPSETKQEFLK